MEQEEIEKTIAEQQRQIKQLQELVTKLSVIVCKKHQPKLDHIMEKMSEIAGMNEDINKIIQNTNTIIDNFEKGNEEGMEKQEHYIG